MLWLALHLPALALETLLATLQRVPQQPARPVALVAQHRITQADAQARRRGIRPGLKRSTALALAADLLLAEADPARDAAALLAVAHAALAFTPAVTLEGAEGDFARATVLLEVQASLRLFGGLPALVAQLAQALAALNPPQGHALHIAAAPTALGAALLARRVNRRPGRGAAFAWARDRAALARRLDAEPVWQLGPGRKHWDALQGMGLATLAELRALPRAGLARRFGEALLDELDRAYGDAPDPRIGLTLPERFDSRLELLHRADDSGHILAAAAVLLARLVAWAQGRHARIAAFTLEMQHETRHREGGTPPVSALRIELAQPSNDPAHLQLLLRERLAALRLEAPTLELRLSCRSLVAGTPPSGELFPSREGGALGLARLLERLRARLGDAGVQRLVPVADHRPERATREVPALQAAAGDAGVAGKPRAAGGRVHEPAMAPPPGLPLHRPLWLLPVPLPLPAPMTRAAGEPPPLLGGRALQLLGGPERIEAGWWDGGLVTRDYHQALAADGRIVWIWRPRLPHEALDEQGQPQWFLQGLYG